jgi:hypothetical protein
MTATNGAAAVSALAARLRNKGFLVKDQEESAYLLVHPSRGKFDWEVDELAFRSVVLHGATGAIVSSGWPKFFNQGEWPDHDALIASELAAGRAVITHKHDGSLIIRSVLPDGRVLFRTRDTFDGGKFAPLAEDVARNRYPALLDASFWPHGSLLFEYVGAGNQIVVRYEDEDDLVLLGAATHGAAGEGVAYLSYPDLAGLADAHALHLVECYDWADASGGIAGVLALVQGWDRAEGVVVRSGDGQTLLKIKSAWYFAQHALRWHMTYEAICRFAIDGGYTDEAALTAALMQAGWDFETTVTAQAHFRTYLDRRAEADRIREAALAFVAAFDSETAEEFAPGDERARRKAFASRVLGPAATAETRAMSKYLFLAFDGKEAALGAVLLRRVVLGAG